MTVEEWARRLCAQPGAAEPPTRIMTRCLNCGSTFDRRLNKRRFYCSVRCRYAWRDLAKGRTQPRLDFGR